MSDTLRLEAGRIYLDGFGEERHVMGPAKTEQTPGARVFWTREGSWYREDGAHRFVSRDGPHYYIDDHPCNLVSEAPGDPYAKTDGAR